jgi:hypothetical protein
MYKPTLVKSFMNKPIQLISAGAHHSAVMSQRGDVYVCGNNADGQLGLGDTETRSTFTWVRSLADKNVYRIFCGGNHTWVLIDEFLPIRNRVRAPSPLFEVEDKPISPKTKSTLKSSMKADKENIHQANELKKKS